MVASTHSRKNIAKRIFSIALCLVLCFFVPLSIPQKKTFASDDLGVLAVHYIDVGQGDAVFIQLPDEKTMLIDAGPKTASDVVVGYLKSLEVDTINYLVLTHSDEDHSGGMVSVFENFEVENIFRPFVIAMNASILPEGDELDELFVAGTEILMVSTNVYANFIKYAYSEMIAGEMSNIFVNYDGCILFSAVADFPYMIEFHNPPKISTVSTQSRGARAIGYPTKFYGNDDTNSVSSIISITYGNEKFLFCGDSTEKSETDFINNLPKSGSGAYSADSVQDVSVLMVPHHGSKTSSSQKFLDIVKPSYAVISVGEGNTYGHPNNETLTRLNAFWSDTSTNNRILRTDKNKNILVSTNGDGLSVSLGVEFEVRNESPSTPSWVIYVVIGVSVLILVSGIVYKIVIERKKLEKKTENYSSSKNSKKTTKKVTKRTIVRSVKKSLKK